MMTFRAVPTRFRRLTTRYHSARHFPGHRIPRLDRAFALVVLCFFALNTPSRGQSQSESFSIDGQNRELIVFANSKAGSGAPVVFVFHGHGGTARHAARRFRIHELWPEAITVYLQGETGVQGMTDPEGRRSGWQKNPGDLGDRDLKFFDSALERMVKKYGADPRRVYALGHSNGARFVNVLWNMRGDKIAALCSSAGPGGRLIVSSKPKPVFIIAGEKDQLVAFETQRNSIEFARRLLRTDSSKAKIDGLVRTEIGVDGAELVTYIHPGDHQFPTEALPSVITFFKRHTLR